MTTANEVNNDKTKVLDEFIFSSVSFVRSFVPNSMRKLIHNRCICAGIAADVTPAAREDKRLYPQVSLSRKNQDILNDDALHSRLARSVLKIALFELANSTFIVSKNAGLTLNAKCEIR